MTWMYSASTVSDPVGGVYKFRQRGEVHAFEGKLIHTLQMAVATDSYETYRRWKLRRTGDPRQQAYYKVKPIDRALVAAVYLSLVALLVVGMHTTHLPRTLS